MAIKHLIFPVVALVTLAHGASAQQIALTIDDSPGRNSAMYSGMERSQVIIQQLADTNVDQVAFFVIGEWADSRQGLKRTRMYAEAGHLIANHSYHHWNLDKVDAALYAEDILDAEAVIGDLPNFMKWYRFPLLHEGDTPEKRDHLREFLASHDYRNGYATVDNWDFYINRLLQIGLKAGRSLNKDNLRKVYLEHMWNAIAFYDGVAKQFIPHPVKHTLLLHDNDVTAMFIKDLVELLREKDWTIVSPEDTFADTFVGAAPDVMLNNQGRVMAIAKTRGYAGPYRSGEDEQSLQEMFDKYKVWMD